MAVRNSALEGQDSAHPSSGSRSGTPGPLDPSKAVAVATAAMFAASNVHSHNTTEQRGPGLHTSVHGGPDGLPPLPNVTPRRAVRSARVSSQTPPGAGSAEGIRTPPHSASLIPGRLESLRSVPSLGDLAFIQEADGEDEGLDSTLAMKEWGGTPPPPRVGGPRAHSAALACRLFSPTPVSARSVGRPPLPATSDYKRTVGTVLTPGLQRQVLSAPSQGQGPGPTEWQTMTSGTVQTTSDAATAGATHHLRAASASLRKYSLNPSPGAMSPIGLTYARKPNPPYRKVNQHESSYMYCNLLSRSVSLLAHSRVGHDSCCEGNESRVL